MAGFPVAGSASSSATVSRPGAQRSSVASPRRPVEVGVTFADIALYFSRDEWHLLDEAQRRLYLGVMLETFELISSLGCCCGAEDVEELTEQDVSVRVAQAENPKVALLSSRESHPCESCGPVLRYTFFMTEAQETQPRQKSLQCRACAKQFYFNTKCHQHQEYHVREKPFRRGVNRMLLAEGCNVGVSQKLFTCGEVGQDILTESEHLQQEGARTRDSPNEISPSGDAIQSRENYFTLSECKTAIGYHHACVQKKGVHTGRQCFVGYDGGNNVSRISSFGYCQRVPSGEKPHQCCECWISFKRRSNLYLPETILTAQRSYECSECGKCFTDSSRFLYHRRIHTGERPYACSECGKSFTRSDHLLSHQRLHAGERFYECSECGKSFSRKNELRGHQNIHTGEKPYVCSECGKSYHSKNGLRRHQRVHTGERPYECSKCGKSYRSRTGLQYHLKIHTE